jgi:hypothetical protein
MTGQSGGKKLLDIYLQCRSEAIVNETVDDECATSHEI